jgi:hypothetical protein
MDIVLADASHNGSSKIDDYFAITNWIYLQGGWALKKSWWFLIS